VEKPLPVPAGKIAECRRELADLAKTWRRVAARSAPRAKAEAEAQVFNQMVVGLQARFGDERTLREPQIALEVRMLAEGVEHGGWFPGSSLNWDVQGSVTGYRPGDRIALSEDVFTRLTEVFLDRMMRNPNV
jgi:hypothetical protein